MKVKTLKVFAGTVLCLGLGVGVFAAVAQNVDPMAFSRSSGTENSFTITAEMLETAMAGDGTFSIGEYDTWKVEKATFETIGGLRYVVFNKNTTIYSLTSSGDIAVNNRRGAGYTGATINNKLANDGANFYHYKADETFLGVSGIGAYNSDADNYNFPAYDGEEIAKVSIGGLGAGAESYLKFTSVELRYSCESADPYIDVSKNKETDVSFSNGETFNVKIRYKNVADKNPAFVWTSSDDDIATVTGDQNGAVVTAHSKAGSVTITCTMTVDGPNSTRAEYTDSVSYTVTAVAATVINMKTVSSGTKLQGASVFLHFNPSSASIQRSALNGLAIDVTLNHPSVKLSGNADPHLNENPQTDSDSVLYIPFDSAGYGDGTWSIKADFKDNTNNKIYRINAYFKGTEFLGDNPIYFSGETSLSKGGSTTVITAHYFGEDEITSYAWESSDSNKATVTTGSASTTVTSGNETGEVILTITLNGDMVATYTLTIINSVTYNSFTILTSSGQSRKQGNILFFVFANEMGLPDGAYSSRNGDFEVTVTAENSSGNYEPAVTIHELQGVGASSATLFTTFGDAFPDSHSSSTIYTMRVKFQASAGVFYEGWIRLNGKNGDPIIASGGAWDA